MKRSTASLSFTIVLLVCSATFAGLDQLQETQNGGAGCEAGFLWGQTFTAGLAGMLDRVELAMYVRDAGIPTTVEIRTTAAGKPTATILGSILVPAGGLTSGFSWNSFDFSSQHIASTPGTMYAIVIWNNDPTPGGTNSIMVNWAGDGIDRYSRGAFWTGVEIGPGIHQWHRYPSSQVPADAQFRTYVGPGAEATCTGYPAMDFNGDCKVDFGDLAIFLDSWLECNLDPPEACWE